QDKDSAMRATAIRAITDQELLSQIVLGRDLGRVRVAAVKGLTDQKLLMDIAKQLKLGGTDNDNINGGDYMIQQAAVIRLKELRQTRIIKELYRENGVISVSDCKRQGGKIDGSTC